MSALHLIPFGINFTITVTALFFILRKPLRKFVYQRHEKIKDLVHFANKSEKEAQDRLEQAEKLLSTMSEEEKRITAQEIDKAQRRAKSLLEKNEESVRRMEADAQRIIENEARQLEEALFLSLLNRAEGSAKEKISSTVKEKEQKELLKKAVNQL